MTPEFSFNGQRPHEKVMVVVRNHPLVLFLPGLRTIAFWSAAVALIVFWSNEYSSLLAFILAIVGLGNFSRAYYAFHQSCFVVTNERAINVGQNGFFGRKITETELNNIQDVASETAGPIRTMFKYGNLTIRTSGAAQGSEIIARDIANPYEVQQLIANTK